MFCDSGEAGSSAAVLNHFHIMYKSVSSIEHLFFSFSSHLLIYQLDFSVFWPVWHLRLAQPWTYLSSCFEVSVFF